MSRILKLTHLTSQNLLEHPRDTGSHCRKHSRCETWEEPSTLRHQDTSDSLQHGLWPLGAQLRSFSHAVPQAWGTCNFKEPTSTSTRSQCTVLVSAENRCLTFLCKVFVNNQLSVSQVVQYRSEVGGISVN